MFDFEFEALDVKEHFSDKILYYFIKGLGAAQKRLTENVEKGTDGSDFLAHHRSLGVSCEG